MPKDKEKTKITELFEDIAMPISLWAIILISLVSINYDLLMSMVMSWRVIFTFLIVFASLELQGVILNAKN